MVQPTGYEAVSNIGLVSCQITMVHVLHHQPVHPLGIFRVQSPTHCIVLEGLKLFLVHFLCGCSNGSLLQKTQPILVLAVYEEVHIFAPPVSGATVQVLLSLPGHVYLAAAVGTAGHGEIDSQGFGLLPWTLQRGQFSQHSLCCQELAGLDRLQQGLLLARTTRHNKLSRPQHSLHSGRLWRGISLRGG